LAFAWDFTFIWALRRMAPLSRVLTRSGPGRSAAHLNGIGSGLADRRLHQSHHRMTRNQAPLELVCSSISQTAPEFKAKVSSLHHTSPPSGVRALLKMTLALWL
jgi:hypothetical protein